MTCRPERGAIHETGGRAVEAEDYRRPIAETRVRARASQPLHECDLVVRPVTDGDADLLVAWHRDPDVVRFWDGKTFTREELAERLGRGHVDPYLIEAGGEPVGYIQAWFEGEDTGIDMFLIPAARGRGLGPASARILVGHLLASGRPRVTVDPYIWNAHAIAAWSRTGFRPVEERPADDVHSAAWLLMEVDTAMLEHRGVDR